MKELVFLLEERSAEALLKSILPRVIDTEQIAVRYISFEGKQDLEKQLVRKIRFYRNNRARFIVLRDQDSHPDCTIIKMRLMDLCRESGRADHCMIRIACRELETFYLADLQAVERAFSLNGLTIRQNSQKYRLPDRLGSPSRELATLTRGIYEKVEGSRAIGHHLDTNNERSPSFKNLIKAIRRLENELLQ